MKTFSIRSLGCKVNQYEGQQVRQFLEERGLAQVKAGQSPDLVIVNTCCVTGTASAKSRQSIGRAQRLYPGAIILVTGCLPSLAIHERSCLGDDVLIVRDRPDLADELSRISDTSLDGREGNNNRPPHPNDTIRPHSDRQIKPLDGGGVATLPHLTRYEGQTRAFLKVQDGCARRCAYCVVPLVRPVLSSKPIAEAVAEAQALVRAGHQEIVITGVVLGAYGQDTVPRRDCPQGHNPNLPELLGALAQIPGLNRLRLSSMDPSDVTPEMVAAIRRHPNIMPHLHLSLQSGSDEVLKRMGRRYKADDFRRVVTLVKSSLDRPALTTDVIVGFPGETDADFEQTVAVARYAGFAKMHVFAFSPRQGTRAATMADKVPPKVTQERSRTLHRLDRELGRQFREAFIGQTAQVLIEDDRGRPSGLSERYFTVFLDRGHRSVRKNQIVKVALRAHCKDGLAGEMERTADPVRTETRRDE